MAAYFSKAGGGLCCWGFSANNQQHPSGLQTRPLYSKPCSPPSLGECSTWPQVSYSSQVCLQSAAPAWYSRMLSTVSGFHFSDTCYFTFKVGHQWRTEDLFLHSNFLGWRRGGLCIPSGGKSLPVYACVNSNNIYIYIYTLMSCSTIQNKAFVLSFFPSLTNSPHGWSSCSFTISSVHLLTVLAVFRKNINYSQWSVAGFCLWDCADFKGAVEARSDSISPENLAAVVETSRKAYSPLSESAWTLLHEPEQKMSHQTISHPITLKTQ